MAGKGGKVVAMIVVGLLAAGVLYQVMNKQQPAAAPRKSSGGPPPDAEFVTDPPLAIIGAASAGRTPAQQQASRDQFVGLWVPEPGWEGPVEEITNESSGVALRLLCRAAGVVGGEYWIIAIVGDDHGCKKGDTVHVQGKIREVRTIMSGPSVVHRIVLEDARVLGPITR